MVVHPNDGMLFSAKNKREIKPWRDTTKCTLPSENIASERLHSVRFQLQDILEKARLWRWQKDQWSEGGDGAGMDTEHAKDF